MDQEKKQHHPKIEVSKSPLNMGMGQNKFRFR